MRVCDWCGGEIPPTIRSHASYCCKSHSASARSSRWRDANRDRNRLASLARKHRQRRNPEHLAKERLGKRRRYRIRVYGSDIGDDPINFTKDRYRHARAAGYRSGLEVVLDRQLKEAGIDFSYEQLTIPWIPKPKVRRYKPDFVLLENGIVVESKGRFITADRSKHKEVKEQHPDLDIRFVFSNSNARISKQSKTTYGMWCSTHGFQFCDKRIPLEWLREAPNKKSLAAIKRLMEA